MDNFTQKDATVRTHYQTVTTGVLIPAAQALVTGVWLGVTSGVLGYFLGSNGWRVGFISFVFCATICWLYLMSRWMSLVWQIEQWVQTDTDNDRIADSSVQPIQEVKAVIRDRNSTSFIDLPVSPEKLSILARGLIIKDLGVTENIWVTKGIFTLPEFRRLRSILETRGLIRLRKPSSHRHGYILTHVGREFFLAVIEKESSLKDKQRSAPPTLPVLAGET